MSISVVWPGREGVEVEPRDVPPPGPGELKIRIEASGLCGTDIHIASGEYPFARPGVTIGHEFAGIIVEVGPEVEGFGVGERVVVDPNIPCRTCEYCHDSRPHLCVRPQALGVTLNGGAVRVRSATRTAGIPRAGRLATRGRRTHRTSGMYAARRGCRGLTSGGTRPGPRRRPDRGSVRRASRGGRRVRSSRQRAQSSQAEPHP